MVFKVGKKVRLTTGGPEMAVEKVEQGQVHCAWFDKAGKLHRKQFATGILRDAATIDKIRVVLVGSDGKERPLPLRPKPSAKSSSR